MIIITCLDQSNILILYECSALKKKSKLTNHVLLWNFVQVYFFIISKSVLIVDFHLGGSLYNVLEEPEYIYGLKETDLKKLIKDVTSGMSYLREKVVQQ